MRYLIRHAEKGLVIHESVLEVPKGATLVCYHKDGLLDVYYAHHRDYGMDTASKAYHACLIAQAVGLHAGDMRYSPRYSLGKQRLGMSQKQLALPLDDE